MAYFKLTEIPLASTARQHTFNFNLEYILRKMEDAMKDGRCYCWIENRFLDSRARSILETNGYTIASGENSYYVSW